MKITKKTITMKIIVMIIEEDDSEEDDDVEITIDKEFSTLTYLGFCHFSS